MKKKIIAAIVLASGSVALPAATVAEFLTNLGSPGQSTFTEATRASGKLDAANKDANIAGAVISTNCFSGNGQANAGKFYTRDVFTKSILTDPTVTGTFDASRSTLCSTVNLNKSGGDSFERNANPIANLADGLNSAYLQFEFVAAEGYLLNFDSLSYNWGVSNNNTAGSSSSVNKTAVWYSIDGGAYQLLSGEAVLATLSTTGKDIAATIVDESFTKISGESIAFRIAFSEVGTSTSTGIAQFVQNVNFGGSVTPVPEPSTYALFGGIAAAGVAFAARRRRKG